MCSKEEIEAAVSAKIGPVETALVYIGRDIKEIKISLQNPPCKEHGEKIAKLEAGFKSLKELSDKCEIEKNEEIYPRLRLAETDIATLKEQNKGQSEWSARTWALIMILVGAAINLLGWYLKK